MHKVSTQHLQFHMLMSFVDEVDAEVDLYLYNSMQCLDSMLLFLHYTW